MWIFLYYHTDFFQFFTKDKISATIDTIREFVENFGIFGPFIFTAAGSLAILINLPAVYIICISVVAFGKVVGAI